MQFLDLEFLKSHRFPGGSDSKEFACNAGDPSSVPGLGRSPGKEIGYPDRLPTPVGFPGG